VSGIPHAQFGGYLSSVGGGTDMYPTYLNKYNQVVNQNAPLSITQTVNISGNNLVIQANVEVTSDVTSASNRIQYILVNHQNDEYFSSAIYYSDEAFNLTTVGETQTFEHSIQIQDWWDLEQISAITIVQSWQNKHVLQADIVEISLDNMLQYSSQISDLLSDNDSDGVINPGETISYEITIENTSEILSSDNLVATISFDSEMLQTIDDPSFTFSDQIAIGESISFGFEILINSEIDLGAYNLTLNLVSDYTDTYGNEYVYDGNFIFQLDVSLNQANWPINIGYAVESSPAVIDINGDGNKEIIFGDYDGKLHVIDINGVEIEGFPFATNDDIWGSPAVADLEGDGDIEIVITSKDKHLYILNADGSIQTNYFANQYLMGTPALGNIDDDSELEIVFGGYDSNGEIFVINPNGTDVEGFPYLVDEKIQRGVALADFNDSGKANIVFGTDSEEIFMIKYDATIVDGFPVQLGGDIRTAPSILDVSGVKCIFVGSKDDNFYYIQDDGTINFSIETNGDILTSPAFDHDGYVYFGSKDGFLYAVDLDGNAKEDYPIYLGNDVISSIAIADLDGDNISDIVTGNVDGSVFAIDNPNYPIHNYSPIKSGMVIEDIDGDGDLETIFGTSIGVVIIDNKEQSSIIEDDWNMYRGNLLRNGFIDIPFVGIDDEVIVLDYKLHNAYPNPFNPSTVISFTIPMDIDANDATSLKIYNVSGRLIETLDNSNITPGYNKITWKADNQPSGLYFVTITSGDFKRTQKVMLLK
jgi:hypothetical protein